MKALPFVLIGLALVVAAAAFFIPSQVYVDAGHAITSLFTGKKTVEPVPPPITHAPAPVDDGVAGNPPLLLDPVEHIALTPQALDTTNKLIDTIKNGLGTLATFITILLGLKQLKPVQEQRKAKAAATRATASSEPIKRTGMKVTSRPKR